MPDKELKAAIYQIIEALQEGHLDQMDKFYAADLFCHRPPYPDIHDFEGYKEWYSDFLRAFPDCQFTVDEVIVEGDTAAVWLSYRGTHTGPLGPGIPPTGKRASGPGCIRYHFVEGKVIEEWDYWDELGFWQQLGYELVQSQER